MRAAKSDVRIPVDRHARPRLGTFWHLAIATIAVKRCAIFGGTLRGDEFFESYEAAVRLGQEVDTMHT